MEFNYNAWVWDVQREVIPAIKSTYNDCIETVALPEMRNTAPHANPPRKGLHNAMDFRDTLYVKLNKNGIAYVHSDDPRAKWLIKTTDEWDSDNRLLWLGTVAPHVIQATNAPWLRWRDKSWKLHKAFRVFHTGYQATDWYDKALEKAQLAFIQRLESEVRPIYDNICNRYSA